MNRRQTTRPLIIDPFQQCIHEAATKELIHSWMSSVFYRLCTRIEKAIKLPVAASDGVCEAKHANKYLQDCRKLVERELLQLAGRYSSFQWLWYLRRLPVHFFEEGEDLNYELLKSGLAEVSSAMGSTLKQVKRDAPNFPCNDESLNRVWEFCAATRFLGMLHSLIGQAGRGVAFIFDGDNPIPIPRPTSDQEAANALYAKRYAESINAKLRQLRGSLVLPHAGTTIATWTEKDAKMSIAVVVRVRPPQWVSVGAFGNKLFGLEGLEGSLYSSFVTHLVTLRELSRLNADRRLVNQYWWQREAGYLLLLLRLAGGALLLAPTILSTVQFGYILISDNAFRKIFDQYLSIGDRMVEDVVPYVTLPTDYKQFLAGLLGMSGSLWPFRYGPAIRRLNNGWCVDLFAATAMLKDYFEFPASISGEPANARGGHFELAVQETINASPWRPSESMGALRGKRLLRLDGTPVTDVDAIGENNDSLLLISAKSMILSSMYAAGNYDDVRNKISDIRKYMTQWNKIAVELEGNNSIGRNYDFSKYRHIVAPICTLLPVYLPIELANQWAARGLRISSSLSELSKWLHETRAENQPVPPKLT